MRLARAAGISTGVLRSAHLRLQRANIHRVHGPRRDPLHHLLHGSGSDRSELHHREEGGAAGQELGGRGHRHGGHVGARRRAVRRHGRAGELFLSVLLFVVYCLGFAYTM